MAHGHLPSLSQKILYVQEPLTRHLYGKWKGQMETERNPRKKMHLLSISTCQQEPFMATPANWCRWCYIFNPISIPETNTLLDEFLKAPGKFSIAMTGKSIKVLIDF